MVSVQEIELLAGILQRAGVTQIEALFLNDVLVRLRAMVELLELQEFKEPGKAQDSP